jgi:hypothetical protein
MGSSIGCLIVEDRYELVDDRDGVDIPERHSSYCSYLRCMLKFEVGDRSKAISSLQFDIGLVNCSGRMGELGSNDLMNVVCSGLTKLMVPGYESMQETGEDRSMSNDGVLSERRWLDTKDPKLSTVE